MAKLFAEMEDERGIETHKIANKQLCANFYYGSREHSIQALKVCATVKPSIGATFETVTVEAEFVSPQGDTIHKHKEEYIMPPRQRRFAEEASEWYEKRYPLMFKGV